MTEAAQEDLTGMPTPKHDEKTPGRFWVENRDGLWQVQTAHRGSGSSFCVAQINHWSDDARALAEQIVKSLNASGSTREALEDVLGDLLSQLEWETGLTDDEIKDRPSVVKARAALSEMLRNDNISDKSAQKSPNVTEPSHTEGLREALAKCVAFIDEACADQGEFVDGIYESGVTDVELTPDGLYKLSDARAALSGSPAPSTEGLREWQPIETCPEVPGQKILLWWRSCKEPSVGWFDIDEEYHERRKGWPCPELGWRCEGDDAIPKNQHDCTHWMPLPPAPDAARTALAGVTAPTAGGTE